MKNKFKNITITIILLLIVSSTFAEETNDYYFYNPNIKYGSNLIFNPLSLFTNGAYDMIRVNRSNKSIIDQSYKLGMKNVNDNLLHPFKHLDHFGYGDFFKQEFFDYTFRNIDVASYLPNFGLHILGNGMEYAKLAEWYDYHNVKYPQLMSFITTTSYQYMNEVIENCSYQGTNVDPIADMLFFNPMGMILFSLNPIKSFFSEKIPIYSWPLQPVINPSNAFIENTGQQYTSKYQFTKNENLSFFINWGIGTVLGLSYNITSEKCISVGAGGYMNNLIKEEYKDNQFVSGDIDYAIGIYYDKNNSLLASAFITGPKAYNLRINLYPNLIDIKGIKPGFYLGVGEMDDLTFGINIAHIPVGIGTTIK